MSVPADDPGRVADVVVIGAGPTGLLLAGELALGGCSVVVLERRTEVDQALKAGGINGRSTQALARRGLGPALEEAAAEQGAGFAVFAKQPAGDGGTAPRRFDGHFAGLLLHASPELRIPASTVVPQQALEGLLADWLDGLGVPVRRGHEITGLRQDDDGVTADVVTDGGHHQVRGRYLVGCDGGRSRVRTLTGFGFPGTDPLTTGYQAVVDLDDPESLPLGWNVTPAGLCAHGPRIGRLLTVSFEGPPQHRDTEITREELEDNLSHVSGLDVGIAAVHAATRYTDNARQADTYRRGRILLAGDAAHVHPPFGGQGLNLGLQDAANLGWKLAATVAGTAPDGLLDSYTRERHPVAARVLQNTRAQVAALRPDPHSRATREVLADLIATTPALDDRLLSMTHGLDIRYDAMPDVHALVGRHVPDLPGLDEVLRLPRLVLLDGTRSKRPRAHALGWRDSIDTHDVPMPDGPAAMLVRPDGYVAWATDHDSDVTGLHEALTTWVGGPRT